MLLLQMLTRNPELAVTGQTLQKISANSISYVVYGPDIFLWLVCK